MKKNFKIAAIALLMSVAVISCKKKAEEVPSSTDEKSKEQFLLNEGQASYYKLYIDDKYNLIKYAVPKIQSYKLLFHPYFKGL